MNTIMEMLDEIKTRYLLGSDYALAKKIGVRKQTVQKWYLGQIPDIYGAARIAELLGKDPLKVIAQVEQLRSSDNEKSDFWGKYMRARMSKRDMSVAY